VVVPADRRRGLRWISGGRREGGVLLSVLDSPVEVRVLGWAGSSCIFFLGGAARTKGWFGRRCGGSSPKIRGRECGSQAWRAELTAAADVVFICRLQRLSGPANVKWRSPRGVRTIFPPYSRIKGLKAFSELSTHLLTTCVILNQTNLHNYTNLGHRWAFHN
jgi:hypothetical protein